MFEEIFICSIVCGNTKIVSFVLILLFTFASLTANAEESPRPVFIHATCDGKVSTAALSSFREEIRTSKKYQLVRALDNDGRMDLVLTSYMSCTERDDVVAVAMTFGQAKCLNSTDCRLTVDGNSIRSMLCDAKAAAECGRTLFKAFDDFMSSPRPSQPRSN